jgi:hypothetical protein
LRGREGGRGVEEAEVVVCECPSVLLERSHKLVVVELVREEDNDEEEDEPLLSNQLSLLTLQTHSRALTDSTLRISTRNYPSPPTRPPVLPHLTPRLVTRPLSPPPLPLETLQPLSQDLHHLQHPPQPNLTVARRV